MFHSILVLCLGFLRDSRENIWKEKLAFADRLHCEAQAGAPVISTASWKGQLACL